jgi:hypothetical protein
MEFFFFIVFAWICRSMAKKRGRSPLLWTFLGLFFHVFAVATLWFLGNKSGAPTGGNQTSATPYEPRPIPSPGTDARRASNLSSPSQRSTPRPTQRNNSPSQNGHIDLNSLRDAVRRSGHGSIPPPVAPTGRTPSGIEPDRQAFLDSLVANAPSAESFHPLPLGTGQALRSAWIDLGRAFVYSGEAGGITDNNEFYQLGDDDDADPVLFYPVSQDGTTQTLVVQFAVPLKRFRSPSREMMDWVNQQPHGGLAQAVAFTTPDGSETMLLAAGVSECQLVTHDSLGIMCEQVRTLAQRLRQTIPQKFGGIWVKI